MTTAGTDPATWSQADCDTLLCSLLKPCPCDGMAGSCENCIMNMGHSYTCEKCSDRSVPVFPRLRKECDHVFIPAPN